MESWRRIIGRETARIHDSGHAVSEAPAYPLVVPQDVSFEDGDPYVRDGNQIVNVKLDEGRHLASLGQTYLDKYPKVLDQAKDLGLDVVLQTAKNGSRRIRFGVGIAVLAAVGVVAGIVVLQIHNKSKKNGIDMSTFIQ